MPLSLEALASEAHTKARELQRQGAKPGPYQTAAITDQTAYNLSGWLENFASRLDVVGRDEGEG